MSALYGRKIALTWKGAPIKGVREKSLTIGGEPVDVSSDEDDGYRVLLTEDATKQIDYEISGVVKDEILRVSKLTGDIYGPVVITYPSGAILSFAAVIGEYSEGQPYQEAVTMSASFMSTGEWTYTPGTPA